MKYPHRLALEALLGIVFFVFFRVEAFCETPDEGLGLDSLVIQIVESDLDTNSWQLHVRGIARQSGYYGIYHTVPESSQEIVAIEGGDSIINLGHFLIGDTIDDYSSIEISEAGYIRAVESWLLLNKTHELSDSSRMEYSYLGSLFVEMGSAGPIEWGSSPILERSKDEPVLVSRVFEEKGESHNTSSVVHTVTVRGRVVVRNLTGSASGTTLETQITGGVIGVPGVTVLVDWDYDNNSATIDNPNDHVPRLVTDINGNFTYTETINSDDFRSKKNIWRNHRLRFVASTSTKACFDLNKVNLFSGDEEDILFFIDEQTGDVDLSISTLSVEPHQGHIVRGIHRGWIFAKTNFRAELPAVPYVVTTSGSHHFTAPVLGVGGPRISHPRAPLALTSYHEYGHYAHWWYAHKFGDWLYAGCDGAHGWHELSNQACSIKEGWANYYAAACYMYWLGVENPVRREAEGPRSRTELMFPDFGETTYPDDPIDQSNGEGAVATFMYSLWDGTNIRTTASNPHYEGDNEDLGSPCGYEAKMLLTCMKDVNEIYPYLYDFKSDFLRLARAVYPSTYWYHKTSINALYQQVQDNITSDPTDKRPATATNLRVSVIDYPQATERQLNWDDNTLPTPIVYAPIGNSGSSSIPVNAGQQHGFLVYRKYDPLIPRDWIGRKIDNCPSPFVVDGRADPDYELIAITGPNATGYLDQDNVPTGYYSYVVVAFSDDATNTVYDLPMNIIPTSISIPKAIQTVRVNTRGAIAIWEDSLVNHKCTTYDPIDKLEFKIYEVAYPAGEFDSVWFEWIYENKPPFVNLFGVNGPVLALQNDWTSAYADSLTNFRIRCIVSDTSGSDTTGYIVPPLYPYDSLLFEAKIIGMTGAPDTLVPSTGFLEYFIRSGERLSIMSPIVTDTNFTKAHDTVSVKIIGTNLGKLVIDSYDFLDMRYPIGAKIVGAPYCGYRVELDDRVNDIAQVQHCDSLINELEYFPANDWCLVSAVHNDLGDVADEVANEDLVTINVESNDTLVMRFSNTACEAIVVDSSSIANAYDTLYASWPRQFFFSMLGQYTPIDDSIFSGIHTSVVVDNSRQAHNGSMTIQPNPVSSHGIMMLDIDNPGYLRIDLYAIDGSRIKELYVGKQKEGLATFRFDAEGIASGQYVVRATMDDGQAFSQILQIRH